jgi:hypothetical protein
VFTVNCNAEEATQFALLVPITEYVVVLFGLTTTEVPVPPVLHDIPLTAFVVNVTD